MPKRPPKSQTVKLVCKLSSCCFQCKELIQRCKWIFIKFNLTVEKT